MINQLPADPVRGFPGVIFLKAKGHLRLCLHHGRTGGKGEDKGTEAAVEQGHVYKGVDEERVKEEWQEGLRYL